MSDQLGRNEWFVTRVASFNGGLNFYKSEDAIEDNELRECENLRPQGDRLQRDTGYKALTDSSGDPLAAVIGVPRKTFEFRFPAGTTETLLVTDLTLFIRRADFWDMADLNSGAATTLSANANGGDTVLNVASGVGFTGGDVVAVTLDDGTRFTSTLASAGAFIVTLDDPLPGAGVVATSGNAVTQGMALAGDADHEVVFTTVNEGANPWVVFTNGVDKVARYDGTDVAEVPNLDGSGSNPLVNTARTVCNHSGHLVLGGTTEGGSPFPYRARWSDTNDPTTWDTTAAGNQGFEDLLDTRDEIVAMLQLGQEVAIYRSRSVVMMEYEGSDVRVFFFRPVIFGRSEASIGVGVVSANAVAPAASGHILLSHDGVYRYTGGLDIELLSLHVDNKVFAAGGEIDDTLLHRSFVQFIDARNEMLIAYCVSGVTYPDRALMLNLETGAFWIRKFTREITSAESHISTTSVSIGELEGTIAEQSWLLGSGLAEQGSPVIFLTSASGGNLVYQYDFISTSDAEDTIVWRFKSKRWRSYYKKIRWQMHQLKIGGENINIVANIGGNTLLLAVGISPGVLQDVRFGVEGVGDSLQYSMAGSGAFVLGDLATLGREEYSQFDSI